MIDIVNIVDVKIGEHYWPRSVQACDDEYQYHYKLFGEVRTNQRQPLCHVTSHWPMTLQVMKVKQNNKNKLAEYLKEATGVDVNPCSLFDIQVGCIGGSFLIT